MFQERVEPLHSDFWQGNCLIGLWLIMGRAVTLSSISSEEIVYGGIDTCLVG